MTNLAIVKYKSKLDSLFQKGDDVSVRGDLYLQSHWSRYVCVMVSGFLEVSIREILSEYTRRHSCAELQQYVDSHLEWFINPGTKKLAELLGKFSVEWKKWLDETLEQEIKDAVDGIVSNRNNISHGKDVGISYVTTKGYYSSILIFINKLGVQVLSEKVM